MTRYIYPVIFGFLDLSDSQIGFLIGATIHDVAQVVGAGFSVSQEAGDAATVAKLFRVALLPVVLIFIIIVLGSSRRQAAKPIVPLFLVVFVLLAVINSVVSVPAILSDTLEAASQLMLVTAIAALGIKTSIKAMLGMGGKKLFTVVSTTGILLIAAMGGLWVYSG